MPGIYLLCSSNPLGEVVLEGTDNKAVCSALPHSVAFDYNTAAGVSAIWRR